MKRVLAVLGAFAVLVVTAIAWAQSSSTSSAKSVTGTWELVSHDYAGQAAPANQREIKILSPKHFMWIIYDKDTMKGAGSGTGTWTLNGSTYTEHIDFIDVGGGSGMNGTDVSFTVSTDGNTLTQSGELGGTKMKEVWKRLD